MKDIEKIKSEDLGCQVQDANPGNFAIEQEVGAMVGATVPAPTAPSADDARELGAQLLVFLRRALLPIKSALRTALADIYAHLDSRCTDYTPAAYASYIPRPYDPMGLTPRTLPNLLTALTAFSPRKISNGSAPNDGIKDGVSLARLLFSADASEVDVIDDDISGWHMTRSPQNLFPNAKKVTLRCKSVAAALRILPAFPNAEEVYMPELEALDNRINYSYYQGPMGFTGNGHLKKIVLDNCKTLHCDNQQGGGIFQDIATDCEVLMPKCEHVYNWSNYESSPMTFKGCTGIKRLQVGKLTTAANIVPVNGIPNLLDLELGESTAVNLPMAGWNPDLSDSEVLTTFLQNFLEHICHRLANRTGQTKLTLTLSADVYTAIMTDNDIKAELVARNWKVTDGTNNFND